MYCANRSNVDGYLDQCDRNVGTIGESRPADGLGRVVVALFRDGGIEETISRVMSSLISISYLVER